MSLTTSFHPRVNNARPGLLPARRFDILGPLRMMAFIAVAALGAQQLALALQSPGQAIRGNLSKAAAAASALPFTATPAEVQEAIEPYFSGFDATVDARGFPASAAVTLHGLDRTSCVDAIALARRIEGRAVVSLAGFSSPQDCGEQNDMTWRIMP